MNRRIRNRTYGGVGGRREQSRLLPDSLNKKGSSEWGILLSFSGGAASNLELEAKINKLEFSIPSGIIGQNNVISSELILGFIEVIPRNEDKRKYPSKSGCHIAMKGKLFQW